MRIYTNAYGRYIESLKERKRVKNDTEKAVRFIVGLFVFGGTILGITLYHLIKGLVKLIRNMIRAKRESRTY